MTCRRTRPFCSVGMEEKNKIVIKDGVPSVMARRNFGLARFAVCRTMEWISGRVLLLRVECRAMRLGMRVVRHDPLMPNGGEDRWKYGMPSDAARHVVRHDSFMPNGGEDRWKHGMLNNGLGPDGI